jgi:hypothetical protein
MNNEPMNLMKTDVEGLRAPVVPAGRTGSGAGFPGTLCLANFHCRFATLADRGGKAGARGQKPGWDAGATECRRTKAGGNVGFDPANELLTRLNPHPPASARINFFERPKTAESMAGEYRRIFDLRFFIGSEESSAKRDGWVPRWSYSLARNVVAKSPRKFGLFHESARKSTKVRTDQARKSAMLRIVTGGINFLIKKPGNEETRNGKRMANHGWTRMNTDAGRGLFL